MADGWSIKRGRNRTDEQRMADRLRKQAWDRQAKEREAQAKADRDAAQVAMKRAAMARLEAGGLGGSVTRALRERGVD